MGDLGSIHWSLWAAFVSNPAAPPSWWTSPRSQLLCDPVGHISQVCVRNPQRIAFALQTTAWNSLHFLPFVFGTFRLPHWLINSSLESRSPRSRSLHPLPSAFAVPRSSLVWCSLGGLPSQLESPHGIALKGCTSSHLCPAPHRSVGILSAVAKHCLWSHSDWQSKCPSVLWSGHALPCPCFLSASWSLVVRGTSEIWLAWKLTYWWNS